MSENLILDRRIGSDEPGETNLSSAERWISLASGAGLIGYGVSRRDLSGIAMAALGGALMWRGASGWCRLYEALHINTSEPGSQHVVRDGIRVECAVTIERPRAEVYSFWRDVENFPRFMKHLITVRRFDDRFSHWVAKGPMGRKVAWDAEIINELPDRLIAWRSLEGADIDNVGSVNFEDGPYGNGTIVRVHLQYAAPAGKIGQGIAMLFGEEPNRQIDEDLNRVKQLMESGEIAGNARQS